MAADSEDVEWGEEERDDSPEGDDEEGDMFFDEEDEREREREADREEKEKRKEEGEETEEEDEEPPDRPGRKVKFEQRDKLAVEFEERDLWKQGNESG